MTQRCLNVTALLLLGAAVGWGSTVNINLLASGQIRNTGWTAGGVYGTNDAQDGRYSWVQWSNGTRTTPIQSGTAHIINDGAFPFPNWRSNIANNAAWVSTAAGPPNINAEAWYTYYTTFTLPNTFAWWNIGLVLDVWADNQPQWVGLYRGSTLLSSYTPPTPPGSPPAGHSSGYDSSPSGTGFGLSAIGSGPGVHTIRFDVYNGPGAAGNPSGLFVFFHSGTALGIPEPSTYVLMGTVGLALYLLRRRKAKETKA